MIQIQDTAGQEEFKPLRDQWIRRSEAFLLMYSVDSVPSFEHIPGYIDR